MCTLYVYSTLAHTMDETVHLHRMEMLCKCDVYVTFAYIYIYLQCRIYTVFTPVYTHICT